MGYLIAETTKEERIALIRQWIPDDDGIADQTDMDLWDIYADFINGKREIAEINAGLSGSFYTEEGEMLLDETPHPAGAARPEESK
jgi:hypothetical protein